MKLLVVDKVPDANYEIRFFFGPLKEGEGLAFIQCSSCESWYGAILCPEVISDRYYDRKQIIGHMTCK